MASRFRRALTLGFIAAACAREAGPPPAASADLASGSLQWAGYVSRSLAAAVGDSSSAIEGIAEHGGRLYVVDMKDAAIYRLTPDGSSQRPLLTVERVGELGIKPGTFILGVTADANGDLYVAAPESGHIFRVKGSTLGTPSFNSKRDVTVFATGAAGANGVGFDRNGHLWISGGAKNALYHVGPKGGPVSVFAKDYATVSSDTTMPVRAYVTNGVAFDSKGNVYTANTGTGEIQKLEVKPDYTPGAITTLVKSDRLLGADGLLMEAEDVLWVAANYSNALMRVLPTGTVEMVADDRPGVTGASDVLKFPAELRRVGNTIYLTNLNFKLGANATQTFTGASVAGIRVK
jgi:sugar lactone lactonase YvrE